MNNTLDEFSGSLLVSLRTGDAQAAALLNNLFRPELLRFCTGYLGDPEEAEDAVQDVFAKALQSEQVPDGLRVWLYAIARNHCLNLRRSQRRRKDAARLPSGSFPGPTQPGFLTALVNRERQHLLEQTFENLPETEREALALRYGEGLSRAEIAEIVGVQPSVIKSRLYEGLKRLRAELG